MSGAAPAPLVAVPFINYNDATKMYEVSPDAATVLEGLTEKIGALFPISPPEAKALITFVRHFCLDILYTVGLGP